MKLNDLQLENFGSICGVILFTLIIWLFGELLLALLILFPAYMIVTQLQLRKATADNTRFKKERVLNKK